MHRLKEFGVSTFEELEKKDFGNYFLAKDITGQDMTPDAAAKSLVDKVNLIDQYILEMNKVRSEHRQATQKSLEKQREKKRTEKLFAVKSKSLTRKPEFKSRVAEQLLFSSTTFLEHGKLMEPWEKQALITPNRVYEKNHKWVPNDDVLCIQKHVYFQDTLQAPPTRTRLTSTKQS